MVVEHLPLRFVGTHENGRSDASDTKEGPLKWPRQFGRKKPIRRWPQYEGDLFDAALASLREGDRKAVMLRFYEHKSFDEIAHILGTAEEAARKAA